MVTLESFEIQYRMESLLHGMEANRSESKHLEREKGTPWFGENIEVAVVYSRETKGHENSILLQ